MSLWTDIKAGVAAWGGWGNLPFAPVGYGGGPLAPPIPGGRVKDALATLAGDVAVATGIAATGAVVRAVGARPAPPLGAPIGGATGSHYNPLGRRVSPFGRKTVGQYLTETATREATRGALSYAKRRRKPKRKKARRRAAPRARAARSTRSKTRRTPTKRSRTRRAPRRSTRRRR